MEREEQRRHCETELGFMDDVMETEPLVNCAPEKAYNPLFIPKEEVVVQEKSERMMEERYRTGFTYVTNAEDNYESKRLVDGIMFEPSAKDPIIWKVECMVGREKFLAFCMMQKFVDLRSMDTKLHIISAFAVNHVKGFVFVEADKLCDVQEACKGLCDIFSSQETPILKNETSHLLAPCTRSTEIAVCMSASVKSGNYKGDLGQGWGVTTKRLPTTVPRLISTSEPEYKGEGLLQLYGDNKNRKSIDIDEGEGSAGCIEKGGTPKGNRKGEGPSGGKEGSSGRTGKGKGSLGCGGNLYEPCELVCFSKKDFGLVLGFEKDGTYKILKEYSGRSAIVTISPNNIKHVLSDVIFTALDQGQKNICVNDTVKVLEGPLKGRQGIVKQVFNGTVFMFDANKTEHGGYFCSESQKCEKVDHPIVGSPEKVDQPISITVENEDKLILKGSTVAAMIVGGKAYIVAESRNSVVEKNARGEEVVTHISSGRINKIPKLNKFMVVGMVGNSEECIAMVEAMKNAVGEENNIDLALKAGENFVEDWKAKPKNEGKDFPSKITLIGWDTFGIVIYVIGGKRKKEVRERNVVVATGVGKTCVKNLFKDKMRDNQLINNEFDCLTESVVWACVCGNLSGGLIRAAILPFRDNVNVQKAQHVVQGVSCFYNELRDNLVRSVICVSTNVKFSLKHEENLKHKIISTVGVLGSYQILGVNLDSKVIVRVIWFPNLSAKQKGFKKLESSKFLQKGYTIYQPTTELFSELSKQFENLKNKSFL